MTIVEGLTLAALIFGPVLAVLVSLWIEERRQGHARKSNTIRTLLIGRLNFADANFQYAINTIPVDFAHEDDVLTAWEEYLAEVAKPAASDAESDLRAAADRWNRALNGLIKAVLLAAGYSERAAAQIARAPYVSTASADLRRQQMGALVAIADVAMNTGRLADVTEKMLARLEPPPTPPPVPHIPQRQERT